MLGKHQSAASVEKYNQLIAQWFAAGKGSPVTAITQAAKPTIVIEEVIAAFWIHAQTYYRSKEGEGTPKLEL